MNRFLLVCFLISTFARTQSRLGQWKALTSILNVRDVIYTEEAIYAATGGGVFEIKDNLNLSKFGKLDKTKSFVKKIELTILERIIVKFIIFFVSKVISVIEKIIKKIKE